MNEIQLKYGCNPNQKPSRIFMEDGSDLPVIRIKRQARYINFLDALNGWQLVPELKKRPDFRQQPLLSTFPRLVRPWDFR